MLKILLLLFFTSLLTAQSSGRGRPHGNASDITPVKFIQVVETLEYDIAHYGARAEPIISTELAVPFSGTIVDVFVNEGDFVEKNTPLYSIVRTIQGSSGDYTPLTVRSLTAGVISKITINPNEEVRDGTLTMTLADISNLKAILSISDKDIQTVHVGLTCTIKEIPNAEANVSKISILPDLSNGLFDVEVLFKNNPQIFAGRFVTVEIPINPVKGTFIPSIAIISRYSKKFVWVLDSQNKVQMAEIQIVNMKGDVTLVTGLQADRWIAVNNTRFLTPGSQTEPMYLKSMNEL